MRKFLVRGGAAAALATLTAFTTVALAASPAHADVWIAATSVSSSTVVLDGDAGCGNRTKVTAKVYAPEGSEDQLWGVSADVVAPNGDIVDVLVMNYASRSGDFAYYNDSVFLCGGLDAPGQYRVQIEATWWDESVPDTRVATATTKFWIKRPTSLTYNATPEPVKKGAKLTHKGQLKIDPVGYGPKKGAKGVTLKFYFSPKGSGEYFYKGKTVTGANGKYSKTFKATGTGIWKVEYAGSSTKQPQVKFDPVKVKR